MNEKGKILHQPKAPHFFKVVYSPLEQGIKIPTLFVSKYGDSLEKVVFLRVPSGAAWPVELLKIDGDTWLQKGWKEFGHFYSIKKFHFLVFRYDGNSQFHVTIFDTTASEIDYPIRFTNARHDEVIRSWIKSEECDDDDDDDDDDYSIKYLGHNSGKKRESMVKIEKDGKENPGMSYVNGRRLRQRIEEGRCDGTARVTPPQPSMASPNPSKKETLKVYRTAKTFTSENPLFSCFMRPSYVSGSFNLNIPAAFVRDYLSRYQSGNFAIRLSEKTNTSVAFRDYLSRNHGGNFEIHLSKRTDTWTVYVGLNDSYGKMYRGWKQFAEENNLVPGDVCLFELLKGTKIFNVIIYRRS